MNANEFLKNLRKVGNRDGLNVRFVPHGKGSDGRVYCGNRFATIKDLKKGDRNRVATGSLQAVGIRSRRVLRSNAVRYVYPVNVVRDESGRFLMTAHDVPEAVTDGATENQALLEMSDALGAALAGYSLAGRTLPLPSAAADNHRLVPVSPLVAAKLSLRTAMSEQGVGNTALAERLALSEGAVRRLVDPDHASRMDGVVAALNALGWRLIVEDDRSEVA